MERKLEELLNTYKRDIRKYLRMHPLSLLDKGTSGIRSFVFYGHDQVLLDIYIDILICNICNLDNQIKLVKKEHPLYRYSDYHFEIDITNDQRTQIIQFIHQMIKTPSMTGKPHIIHIRNVSNIISRQLHHIIDIGNDNIIIFISTPTLVNIDTVLKSRLEMVNLTPTKQQCLDIITQTLGSNDIHVYENFDKLYMSSNGNVIQILLKMLTPNSLTNIETYIITSIREMVKMRSFLSFITKIRDLSQKLYHINAPFKFIAKIIIQEYQSNTNIKYIIELCARTEHHLLLAYKELFVYENFFIELIDILKTKEKLKVSKKKLLKDIDI